MARLAPWRQFAAIAQAIVDSLSRAPRPGFGAIVRRRGRACRARISSTLRKIEVPLAEDGRTERFDCIDVPTGGLACVVRVAEARVSRRRGAARTPPEEVEVLCAPQSAAGEDASIGGALRAWSLWFLSLWAVGMLLARWPCVVRVATECLRRLRRWAGGDVFDDASSARSSEGSFGAVAWGEAVDSSSGRRTRLALRTCAPRQFTVVAACAAAENLLFGLPRRIQGKEARAEKRRGLSTPSIVFGADHCLRVPGLGRGGRSTRAELVES
jgi:hypothetical protein